MSNSVDKKLDPELAEEIGKAIGAGISHLTDNDAIPERIDKVLESFTEKPPEEDITEYKCWWCGGKLYYDYENDNGIICSICGMSFGQNIKAHLKNACYRPGWNNGKIKECDPSLPQEVPVEQVKHSSFTNTPFIYFVTYLKKDTRDGNCSPGHREIELIRPIRDAEDIFMAELAIARMHVMGMEISIMNWFLLE